MNVNQKIYRAIQKGLNEALVNLSIDDFDNVETIMEEPTHEDISKVDNEFEILAWKSRRLLIDKFINYREIIETDEVEELKYYINSHPDVNVGIIKVVGKEQLEEIIDTALEFLGNTANLNWIDTSSVTDMSSIFWDSPFDGDISRWDVSNVTNMSNLFDETTFNGDISKWDVSNVINMYGMFAGSQFNGDISNWNVSNVIKMNDMFFGSKFNRDISRWDVSNVVNTRDMFYNCPISEEYKPKFG